MDFAVDFAELVSDRDRLALSVWTSNAVNRKFGGDACSAVLTPI